MARNKRIDTICRESIVDGMVNIVSGYLRGTQGFMPNSANMGKIEPYVEMFHKMTPANKVEMIHALQGMIHTFSCVDPLATFMEIAFEKTPLPVGSAVLIDKVDVYERWLDYVKCVDAYNPIRSRTEFGRRLCARDGFTDSRCTFHGKHVYRSTKMPNLDSPFAPKVIAIAFERQSAPYSNRRE